MQRYYLYVNQEGGFASVPECSTLPDDKVAVLYSDAKAIEEEKDKIAEDFNDQAVSFQQFRAEVFGLREELSFTKEELKDQKQCVDDLKRFRHFLLEELAEKDKEISNLKVDNENMTMTAACNLEKAESIEAEVVRLIRERDAITTELAEARKEIERLRNALNDVAHCGNYEASRRAIDALKEGIKMSSGLKMKYFVLKPEGNDEYARASRVAMRAYATSIKMIDPELTKNLRDWADKETGGLNETKTTLAGKEKP